VDAARLDEAMDYIQANAGGPGAAESLVVRHGYVIWKGSQSDTRHSSWSCSKSFASTVLGLLIEDGRCTLDTKALKFLPRIAERYPDYAKITLRHFATMTSGYDGVGGGYADKNMDGSSTWFDPAPPLFAPGSAFSYWDDAQSQFGHVLMLAAGEELGRYFKRRVTDPIGMTNWQWGTHASVDGAPESNAASGWLDELTLWQLATQTGGFEKTRGWCRQLKRPGTAWIYSDGGPNWLADCLTVAYGRDLLEVMTERVFRPLGITVGETPTGGDHDLHWGSKKASSSWSRVWTSLWRGPVTFGRRATMRSAPIPTKILSNRYDTDQVVLMRVPQDRIRDRDAYECL
jgi:CubicO group peptidase (beta-lactamase class C family)